MARGARAESTRDVARADQRDPGVRGDYPSAASPPDVGRPLQADPFAFEQQRDVRLPFLDDDRARGAPMHG